jgi:hypothetical protein
MNTETSFNMLTPAERLDFIYENWPQFREAVRVFRLIVRDDRAFTHEEAEVIEAAVSLASCQKMREQYAHHILVIAYNECMLEHVSVDKVVFFRRSYEIWQISRHQWQPAILCGYEEMQGHN